MKKMEVSMWRSFLADDGGAEGGERGKKRRMDADEDGGRRGPDVMNIDEDDDDFMSAEE